MSHCIAYPILFHTYLPTQVQASSTSRGVAIVKLMGKKSGFVAMQVQVLWERGAGGGQGAKGAPWGWVGRSLAARERRS